MSWRALSKNEIIKRVDAALAKNQNYDRDLIIGVPGSYLDQKEFYKNAPFLADAPFLKTLVANPNHIGCHTLNQHNSPQFKGTQNLERELISLCSEGIFKGGKNQQDGYVSSGGTEANLEAIWIYRNYFMKEYQARPDQIGVLFSEDSHYSIPKSCDLMQVQPLLLEVNPDNRQIKASSLGERVEQAQNCGIRYFIVIINVSTTLFGSVDEIDPVVSHLEKKELPFKLHLDAAFGGFIYPFTNPHSVYNFKNPKVSSITLDAHKMLQTPYGTGIFLIRKGFMSYVSTEEAQYVPGLDYTICGSRSGANAISVWMILMSYGYKGWQEKMKELMNRTNFLCSQLEKRDINYFRNPYLNIVSIPASCIPENIAKKYGLVADSYEHKARWWKIVVMDHVSIDILNAFLSELSLNGERA